MNDKLKIAIFNYSAWDTTEKHEEQNWKKLKNEE